jgi:hypothetical protein
MQHDKNPTASALFGVAAIQILVGLLGWFMYSPHFGWLDWIVTISGAIYIALAIAARWTRLSAAIVAAALYAVYLGYQASQNIDLLWGGWIIKVPIVILLLAALIFAIRDSAKRQQNSPATMKPPD